MDDKIQERLNALGCAIRMLDGTAGGYTKEEKATARQVLIEWAKELRQ